MARILSALDMIIAGGCRFVVLTGEPGVGKSRLAQEVLALARTQGMQVVVGRCFEQQTSVPFLPFTEALTLALAGAPALLRAEAPQRWPELAHLLPDLRGAVPEPDGQDARPRVFHVATALVRELAETAPLVLLLEDLHWADATSLGLLLYLGRHLQAGRVLVLATYRDVEVGRQHPLEATLRELVRERLIDQVHLRRLDVGGTAALITNQLGDKTISEEVVTLVHERAEGNPFFTEELVKALVEQGAVYEAGGRWERKALSGIEIPHSVRSVVGQRVSRLTPGAQQLLRLASVIGPECDLDVLQSASGVPESDVLDHLDEALEARLVEERRGDAPDRYAFAHVLIQQTLYQELPRHRARRLHLRIAETLETLHASHPSHFDDLARHFELAGDRERAVRYAIAAGDQAAARYAHAEAVHQYEVAFELAQDLGDEARAAEVQYQLARELCDLNQVSEALATYESALAKFARHGDSMGQALVHRGIGHLQLGRYDLAKAVPHFDEALRSWPAEREDTELASLLLDAARAKDFSSDAKASIPLAERGLALAEHLGDPTLLARALCEVARCRSMQDPRPRVSLRLLERAETIARIAGAWRSQHHVYLLEGLAHTMAGELELALATRLRALDAAERSGEIERVAFAQYAVGETQLMLGAWEDGRAASRAGQALDPQDWRLVPLSWMEGRYEDTLALLRADIVDTRRRDDLPSLFHNLAWLADFSLELGRPKDAEAPAREAFALVRSGAYTRWPGLAIGPLAEVVARLRTSDSEKVLAEADELMEASEQHVARPQLLRARGILLQQQGAVGPAIEAFKASAEAARAQHALIQLGRTLSVLAAVARLPGAENQGADADAECASVVEHVGLEVRGLAWAADLGAPTRRLSRKPAGLLSAREREVTALLAEGLTNRQIADQLVISERTAEHHVESILNKLGLASRAKVAGWAARTAPPARSSS